MGWFADILPAVSAIGGGLINMFGNERAAGQSADSIERAIAAEAQARERERAALEAASQRGIASIRAGTEGYLETVAPMLAVNNRGLTDSQEIQLEDLHREGTADLAASGLRGAGRAGVAALGDTRRRALADFYDTNTARTDAIRSGIANIRADEGRAVANAELGTGSAVGSSYGSQGMAEAEGLRAMGDTRASATIGNASTLGTTLGAIGAIIADDTKRSRGRYDDYSARTV